MTTETNAERLENMSPIGVDGEGNVLIKGEDWHWLGEQAERTQELEVSNERIVKIALNRQKHIDEMTQENACLREENIRFKKDVENYEKAIGSYKQACRNWETIMSIHNQENVHLRKALEFYADRGRWIGTEQEILAVGKVVVVRTPPTVAEDGGCRARQALKGE